MKSAVERARIEAQGPSTTLAMPTPSGCAVVPPGMGMLNIMITNENAAKTEISGTWRVNSSLRVLRSATYQKGAAAPERAA